jgi:DNA-binding response OmpR family regulator
MKKVLIVEDDQFLANAYRAKFSHYSEIEIDIARDGNEALEKVTLEKPDAIILDLVMPNLDGYGFLKTLRERATSIPILVSSNLDAQEDIKRAIDLGAQDYFIKSDSSVKDIIDKVIAIMK